MSKKGVKRALETGRFVHVFLVFVKGIPRASAEEVVHAATDGIAAIEKSFGEAFIRVSPL